METINLSAIPAVLPSKDAWERIPMYLAHKNRLTKTSKKLFNKAWRDQEGICILSDQLLRKSKCVFGIYRTPDKEKFDNMETIPFLLSDSLSKKGKKELYTLIDAFFRNLFEYDGISQEIMNDVQDIIRPLEGEIILEKPQNSLGENSDINSNVEFISVAK